MAEADGEAEVKPVQKVFNPSGLYELCLEYITDLTGKLVEDKITYDLQKKSRKPEVSYDEYIDYDDELEGTCVPRLFRRRRGTVKYEVRPDINFSPNRAMRQFRKECEFLPYLLCEELLETCRKHLPENWNNFGGLASEKFAYQRYMFFHPWMTSVDFKCNSIYPCLLYTSPSPRD